LSNRFVHIEMRPDFAAWQAWAVTHGVHKDVVGYLSFAKQDMYDFDAKSSSRAFATPRSWCFVSELISNPNIDAETQFTLVAGSVGDGLAQKFKTHRQFAGKLPEPDDILSGKVTTLDVKEISAMYSLTVSLCYGLKEAVDNKVSSKKFHEMADNFFTYIMANFETELVVLAAKIALKTYHLPLEPGQLKHFDQFHKKYAKYIATAE
jgi:hypothetical protein